MAALMNGALDFGYVFNKVAAKTDRSQEWPLSQPKKWIDFHLIVF